MAGMHACHRQGLQSWDGSTHLEFWEGSSHEICIDNRQPHACTNSQGLQPVPSADLTAHHRKQRPALRIWTRCKAHVTEVRFVIHTIVNGSLGSVSHGPPDLPIHGITQNLPVNSKTARPYDTGPCSLLDSMISPSVLRILHFIGAVTLAIC